MRVRTFIAFDLPEILKNHIRSVQDRCREFDAAVRWVRPEGVHLTLKFLGDVEEETLPGICSAVERTSADLIECSVRTGDVGAFPNMNRPRVFWLGIKGMPEEVVDFAGNLDRALGKLGFERDGRKLKPHLTLGRVKGRANIGNLTDFLGKADFEELDFKLDTVSVIKSELLPGGARYETLKSVNLKSTE